MEELWEVPKPLASGMVNQGKTFHIYPSLPHYYPGSSLGTERFNNLCSNAERRFP